MAGLGRKEWSPGDTLNAADVNGYLMDQSVMVFAGTAARASAIPTPSAGMVAYSTATNLEYYNGSAWQPIGIQPGLVLVKSQVIGSGVSTVTVSGAFSATYDTYLVTVSGGVASGDLALNLTLGSTATGYAQAGNNIQYGVATTNTSSSSNTTSFQSIAYGSTNALSGQIFLDNPFATKRTMARWQATGSSTAYFINNSQGFLNDATSYTAFTLTTSTGGTTITGGTIRVYGYQNS